MGIVKKRPRGPQNDDHLQTSSFIFLQNEHVHEQKFLLEKTPDDDTDDSELAEVGCENVMVGGQTCSIPYELYDLPDLKGILSIETWNCHLNEDERFYLAAFLPDMDQETFWLTIKELLTGCDMFFGSPLEKFYTGLKGGLYSPQVICLRQGLRCLQRREYHHSLISYHKNMAQQFVEMKKVWERCQQDISVEERIQIWNSRKQHKPVLVVDLNAFPDEDTLNKVDTNVNTVSLSKKTKYMDVSHDPMVLSNGLVCDTKRKAKGVLKLKPIAKNAVQEQLMQTLPDKLGEPSKRLPKGVLKIKPKNGPRNDEKPRTEPERISAGIWGIHNHAPQVSPQQFAFKRDELNFSERLPLLFQIDREGSTYRNSEDIQDWKREEVLYAGSGSYEDSESFQRKTKMMADVRQHAAESCKEWFPSKTNQNLSIYSQEAGQVGECHLEKKIRNSSNAHKKRSIYEDSADPNEESFQLSLEMYQERRLNSIISEAGSRVSNNCTDKHEITTKPSDHLEHGHKDDTTNVSISGVKQGLMFPITYKRKKPYRKLNQVDSLKQQPVVVNLEPAAPSGTIKPKPMSIKIKFRGLPGHNG